METQYERDDVLLMSLYELAADKDVPWINYLLTGRYLNVLKILSNEDVVKHFPKNKEGLYEYLKNGCESYLDEHSSYLEKQLELLYMGIASLQTFVQSNWTGPPFEPEASEVFSWLHSKHCDVTVDDVEFKEEIIKCLILDGESCCAVVTHPEYLLLSRAVLEACSKKLMTAPINMICCWWFLRCQFVHQQILDEFSSSLYNNISKLVDDLEACEALMKNQKNKISFHLEAARIFLFYRHVVKSQDHCKTALETANVNIEVTGALGKRTQFQIKDLAQLTIKVDVPGTDEQEGVPYLQPEHLPKDLKLNDDVRLNHIKFANPSDGIFKELSPLQQAVLLAMFVKVKISQPKDELADEELMPYLTCLLANPRDWCLQMSALLERCRLESHNSRTIERAMMQTEELINCVKNEKPSVSARHKCFYYSNLPPVWKQETELANLLVTMGVIKSALDIYLRLQLWEEVISCYNILQLRHKAAEIIQQELNKKNSVKLWCLLGDATDDPQCYEKAWELSEHKSGRAQRHWALYFFSKKQYAESIPHFQESLSINSLQLSLWLRLGYAALMEQNWTLCASAYQRYCALDPESFEAWNNLSKAYVKLNQKARAWSTLQEALKWNYENWRVWDNFMVVSTDVGRFQEVIHAYNRILDLKDKHVDVEVLTILVNALCAPDAKPTMKKNAEQLLARLTQKELGNSKLWLLYAKLKLSNEDESFEALERTLSTVTKAFWKAVQHAKLENDLELCKEIMDIAKVIVTAHLESCSKCTEERKKSQFLSSAKLAAQNVITKVKKSYINSITGEVDERLKESLGELENLLQNLIGELQQLTGSNSTS